MFQKDENKTSRFLRSRGFICVCLLYPPTVPAFLAQAHGLYVVDDPLLFMPEDLEQQRRHREEDPFDRDPPPAHEEPPEDAVVGILQLGFVDHLNVDIFASAFRADHFATFYL